MNEVATRAMRLTYRLGEPCTKPSDFITEVEAIVADFYKLDGNAAGGKLHIVLDDTNLEREHIEWCREQAREANDEAAYWLAQVLTFYEPSELVEMNWVCACCKSRLRAEFAEDAL